VISDDPAQPVVSDRQTLVFSSREPLRVRTRAAGIFLFLPLLPQLVPGLTLADQIWVGNCQIG
jgi:hypothetical protein